MEIIRVAVVSSATVRLRRAIASVDHAMIEAGDIERAERILQIIYREREAPRQLREMEVDIESFNNWLAAREDVVQRNHSIQFRRTDPRVRQAYATLLMHFFLVGLVCGRDDTKEIV